MVNDNDSRSQIFFKIRALKNFTKFKGKQLCQSVFFYKAADLKKSTMKTPEQFVITIKTSERRQHLI